MTAHPTVPLVTADGQPVPLPNGWALAAADPYYEPDSGTLTCGGRGYPPCDTGEQDPESWRQPRDSETDTPDACDGCGILLHSSLTNYGTDYVVNYVRRAVDEGERNPVTDAWIAYFDWIDYPPADEGDPDGPTVLDVYADLTATSAYWMTGRGRPFADMADWPTAGPVERGACTYCQHEVILAGDVWIAVDATGDDAIWRQTCPDNHTCREAPHAGPVDR